MKKTFFFINSLFIFLFSTALFGMEDNQAIQTLFHAIETKNHKLLRQDLANNTNPNIKLNDMLPLNTAVKFRDYKAVKLLLKAGADCKAHDNNMPFLKNNKKRTAFDSCFINITKEKSSQKNLSITQALIKAGADYNAPDSMGLTPLHLTTIDKRRENLQLLIELRPQINTQSQQLCTPLHICNYAHDDAAKLKILIQAGAAVNIQDIYGRTPLRYAVIRNAITLVKMLLSAPGINTSILCKDGKSDLAVAKEKGYKAIGKLLIAHLGVYSAQGLISHQGLAQILPQEVAEHIATFLFRE